MKAFLLLVLLNLFCVGAQAQLNFAVTIKDSNGKAFNMASLKNNALSVIIVLAPDCPICQKYTLTINTIQAEFKADNVGFYAVFPGKVAAKDITQFAKKYKVNMPLLVDADYSLTKLLGATVTPQAIVINPLGVKMYSGKIDNWYESIAKRRAVITEYYLKDALNAALSGSILKVKETTPVGCFIF